MPTAAAASTGDWGTFIAIAAFGLSVLSYIVRAADKNISIREHDLFKDGVERDIDRLERRIERIEETRPTTGELQATIKHSPKGDER